MIVPVSRLLSHARPINAKFILPALTEATDPYWRPIKYSLFPPLGLATLAAYPRRSQRAKRRWHCQIEQQLKKIGKELRHRHRICPRY